MTHQVAIYVPSTLKGTEPAPASQVERWTHQAKVRFAQLFGGFTAYAAKGGWLSPLHGLIEEDVTIVQAFTDDARLAKGLAEVKQLALSIGQDMHQEAVTVQVDGIPEFVYPTAVQAA